MKFKNFTTILAILLLNVYVLVAQDAHIDWYKSKSTFGKGYFNNLKVIDANENYIWYLVNTANTPNYVNPNFLNFKKLFLSKLDIAKDTTYTCELNFKIKDFDLKSLKAVQQNGVLNIFSTFLNRKDEKLYLFRETFDMNGLRSNNDIKKVLEVDMSIKGTWAIIKEFARDINKILVQDDLDNQYALIFKNNKYIFQYYKSTKEGEYVGFEVFDQDFNPKWKTFQPVSVQFKNYYEYDHKIDGQGNIYTLVRGYKSDMKTFENFSESALNVVCYPKSGEKATVIPVTLENNYFVTAANLAINNNNNNEIIVAGMYANAGCISAVGCFSKIYDLKLSNEKSSHLKPLSKELLVKGEDKKVVSLIDKNKEFDEETNYVCDSIHLKENGDFNYVIEKYQLIKIKRKDENNIVEVSYEYVFDDIYVMSFSSNGSVKWIKKAPKKTHLFEAGIFLGSYGLFYDYNDNTHLIYNSITEKGSAFSDFAKPNRKGPTTHVMFDKDGNEKVNILSDTPDISNCICPHYAIKTTNNSILIPRFPFLLGAGLSKKNNFIEFGELKFN